MSPAIQQLADSLARLHANGHPLGLARERAQALARDLGGGMPLERVAERAGLDPRLVEPCVTAGVADPAAALLGLIRVLGPTSSHRRTLRAAGSYPLVLAVVITATAGLVLGVMGPAMATLPLAGEPGSPALLALALALAVLALLVLAATVLGRVPLPWIGEVWRDLDGYAFLAGLEVLSAAGAPLPAAVRGAACWCRGAPRQRAMELARSLEAGRAPPVLAPLLAPLEASMLHAAARADALPATLEALVRQRVFALARQVPTATIRVHTVALVLAGLGMLVVGGSFFFVYSQAVGGG